MSVLVLLAHPNVPPSRCNAELARTAAAVDGVDVHDLYDAYPHFLVDAGREQARVAPHRTLVFQHPLYWYSVPPLLKQWYDTVLTRGWAYGPGADALSGKVWTHAISSAGSERTYAGG
jgi:glutathione-regulated potassium-efflux system ancillary protein KefG